MGNLLGLRLLLALLAAEEPKLLGRFDQLLLGLQGARHAVLSERVVHDFELKGLLGVLGGHGAPVDARETPEC